MIQKLTAPISVFALFNHKRRSFEPFAIMWEGRQYKVKKIGYHHKIKEGNTLFHIFSILCDTLFFRLKLNTDNLLWTVEEISDGETN